MTNIPKYSSNVSPLQTIYQPKISSDFVYSKISAPKGTIMSTSALKASPSELRYKDTSHRDEFEPAFTTEDATKYPLLTKYASRDRLEPSNNQTIER